MKRLIRTALFAFLIASSAANAADYGLPAKIQDGNILQCFDWPVANVKEALPDIAAAGFGSVQISPIQRSDIKSGEWWHTLYRPYDIAFKSSLFCSESDITSLCTEADKYGIKVIVDVVANHVDKTFGYHSMWWDSNDRVRWEGGINYGSRYSITHGQLGDYGDINSEDPEVIARAKEYVEKLKSFGVDGIRWDAAKHIGLPSEGCDFWKEVASVEGMYHYGEILDAPGPDASIIKEYAKYMSVTDNRYCNYAARDNGGIPGGYGGEWAVNYSIADSKLVYWGESHDTYCNDDWSKNRSQAVIDRAYAAYACRKGATCLYFSRPLTSGNNNIRVGKGSTAFTGKHIAEVNKFRNIMVGKSDWFETNGTTCSITRQNGGAVIVTKGSGNVTITNGGGYCPEGTYTDRVAGGKFTVTATTISGTVGSSGIAVIYNDGTTPDPIPDPTPDPTGKYYCYFDNTNNWNVKVWAWNDSENCTVAGEWPGDDMTTKDGKLYWEAPAGKVPTGIIFSDYGGTKAGGGDLPFVNGATYKPDGSYTIDETPDPTPVDMPSQLYVLGNIFGQQWTTNQGVQMHKNGNRYEAYSVVFESTGTDGMCYFNLTDALGADWDALNQAANRYGAATEGVTVGINASAAIKLYANNIDASACKSWSVKAGTYNVVADFSTMMIELYSPSAVEMVVEDNIAPVYYNLQGIKVDNPHNGLFIKVTGNKVEKVLIGK